MIIEVITELETIFEQLNKNLFDNKLRKPVIIVQSKKKRNTLGACSVNPIWVNKNKEDDKNYEIMLSAEFLNRPLNEIVATLLHEMIHLHCALNEINDTSNDCVYHNKKFKKEAENHGLEVTRAKTIGWSVTALKEETIKIISKFKINDKVFDYYRQTIEKKLEAKPIHKYICEGCNLKVSHYKEINIKCVDCNKDMIERL